MRIFLQQFFAKMFLLLFVFLVNCGSLNSYFVTPVTSTEPPQPSVNNTPLIQTKQTSPLTFQTETPQPSDNNKPLPHVLAFPGAEGFGAETIGGRNGKILEVTNLDDDGPGSLRAAIEDSGARIIIFRVAGTIELKSALEINNPYVTIAGQTAPGGGITLRNYPTNMEGPLLVNTHDVIIRYIRSRPGSPIYKSDNGDAIEILGPGAYHVIVDHCSFSWAIDEVVSTWYDAHDITIQWSIISEGLFCSNHVKGCHSMGLLVGGEGAKNISIHHNLLANNHERNPLIETSGLVDIVNNVIYNAWGSPALFSDAYGKVFANLVANYQKNGPDSDQGKYFVSVQIIQGIGPEIYVNGNITPLRPSNEIDQLLAVKPNSRDWIIPDKFDTPEISTVSALQAYEQVLAESGATIGLDEMGKIFPRRDEVDQRIVDEVKNGTGRIIDDPSQVGGWPQLDPGMPLTDTDHDGMPDRWEQQFGFDPLDSSDAPRDEDGDGYTNIEEYLNITNPLN
jgi:pectate lyase